MYSVSEMMKKTGVSRRTLHYYDQIGLLSPAVIKENGYRAYSENDVIRLQQILLLKSLGYSLSEIADLLNGQNLPEQENKAWIRSLELQISWIDRAQEELDRKRSLLQSMIHAIGARGRLHADELLELLQELGARELLNGSVKPEFNEQQFTPEEERILSNLPIMGSRDMRVDQYIEIIQEIRAKMHLSPASEEMQKLAMSLWNWALQLFEGNVQLLEKYWSLLQPTDDQASPVYGHDPELVRYMNEMMKVLDESMERDAYEP